MTDKEARLDAKFYLDVQQYLEKIARYKLSLPEDVDDAVAETMKRLFVNRDSLSEPGGWYSLGSKILRDEIVNIYRRTTRSRKLHDKLTPSEIDHQQDVERTLEQVEQYDRVQALIRKHLSPLDQTLLALHMAGYKDTEIVYMLALDITPKTVNNRRLLALKKIRSLYAK